MKKIIIGFAITLTGANGLSNELCSTIGPDALVQRFERCGEGEICGVLTDGSLCKAFQRNYNESFEMTKEASLFRDLFYTHLSAVEKQKAHLTVLPVPKDLLHIQRMEILTRPKSHILISSSNTLQTSYQLLRVTYLLTI